MKSRVWFLIAALVIVAAAVVYKLLPSPGSSTQGGVPTAQGNVQTLTGLIGSEKEALFNDPDFQAIALKDYKLQIEAMKAGSLEMTNPALIQGKDFVFPASEGVVDRIKLKLSPLQVEPIFRTPVVLYSWDMITQPLISEGIVKKVNQSYYVVDFNRLVSMIIHDKKWAELAPELKSLYGTVAVITSDPVKSNSGNSFAAMIAVSLNQGSMPTKDNITSLVPQIRKVFTKLGFKKSSTSDVFNDYLSKGIGASPMIAGYESDMIAFASTNTGIYKKLMKTAKPVILYPEPTVWSTHDYVALTPEAKKMTALLKDPRIQKLAWEKYGFRSGVLGENNDFTHLAAEGVPKDITNVMSMPDVETMDEIVNGLK
ncbi:hypothetical protein [Paenibacillus sp. J22TS3]|uniref:hypothetical protein n=1 Tax=Paenibacillus sp. J22TS3 TaxID=2807192 RepID=UPI001B0F9E7D|nr:hypothetical protein [Paenibacillus sp. J22TS3]GIP22417.1 hypothetical protein J22TS3_26920 [Paenibacillus sp. J22TS3]